MPLRHRPQLTFPEERKEKGMLKPPRGPEKACYGNKKSRRKNPTKRTENHQPYYPVATVVLLSPVSSSLSDSTSETD